MRITVRVPRSKSCVEPELLVRFVIQRCREVTKPPPVLVALTLAAVSRDHDFYNRLKDLISSSSDGADILRMCHEVFLTAFGRFQDAAYPDGSHRSEEYPFPDERSCKQVLRYALREGKRMLASRDYEFVKVLEFLLGAGLQPYAVRLYQFEAVRQSFQDDPENLVRKGLEIIKVAAYQPRKKK
jgi:hypothetical protein